MGRLFDFSQKSAYDFYSKDFGGAPQVPKPTMSPTPTPTKSSIPAPVMKALDYVTPKGTYMSGNLLQKGMDLLSTPSYAVGGYIKGSREKLQQLEPGSSSSMNPKTIWEQTVAGVKAVPQAIKTRTTPSQVLRQSEPNNGIYQNPWAGFGIDVATDPTNLIPLGFIGRAAKVVPGAKQVMTKVDDVGRVIKELPIVEKTAQRFIKGYGIEDDVVRLLDNIPDEVGRRIEPIIQTQKELFKIGTKEQLTPDEIKAIAYFLEPNGAGAGQDLAALRKSLGTRFDEVIRPILRAEKKINQQLVIDAAQRGNLKGAAKELYNRPYFAHQFERTGGGFVDKVRSLFDKNYQAPERVAGQTTGFGAKVGVNKGYWKARKGKEGFITNVPEVMSRRQIQQLKDDFVQDALREIGGRYGKAIRRDEFGKVLMDTVPEGYRVVTGASERLRDLYNVALPNNIADYLDETLKEAAGWQKTLDSFNAIWKPVATTLNPGFHLTNMIGNMYNSFLGGMTSPKRFFQLLTGTFTKAEDDLVKSSGILQRGEFLTDVAKREFGSIPQKAFQTPNRIGGWVENNARKALFLDAYEKMISEGMTDKQAIKKAASLVDEFLFNYQTGLTPFEQNVMRRFFPFYSWFRHNVPLQAKSVVNQTGKPLTALKAVKAANNNEMPEDLSIPTGMTDKDGRPIRYRVPLPLQDITNAAKPETARDMLNPVFKLGVSNANWLASGMKQSPMDYWSGQELTNPDLPKGEQVRDVAGKQAVSLVRPARTAQKIQEDSSPLNIARALIGGFYSDYGAENKFMDQVKTKQNQKKAIKQETLRSLKKGDTSRAKRLERYNN